LLSKIVKKERPQLWLARSAKSSIRDCKLIPRSSCTQSDRGQIYDPDDIREVEDLYKDRLAIREQVDWEGRLIGLQLMHLREFQALKVRHIDDGLSDGSSVSSRAPPRKMISGAAHSGTGETPTGACWRKFGTRS
jgi:hypothetical protein